MTRYAIAPIAAFAAAMLAAGAVQAQDEVVRIGTEGAYPPFNATDASGELVGFEVDLGRALCERAGVTCEFVAQDWDGIIPALLSGRYDMIMAGMTITDERREQVDFSRGYVTTPAWFVAPSDSALLEAETIADVVAALDGRTLGVQRSTIHQTYAETQISGATINLYDTQDDLYLDLLSGRIDAALADSLVLEPFLASEEGSAFAQFGPGLTGADDPIFGEGIGIAFRQEDDALRERFDEALDSMRADGSLAALATQWFGYDIAIP